MEVENYLKKILESHSIASDSKEMEEIRSTREEVEEIIRENFGNKSPTIKYGGSKAKNTMIIDSYDLDIVCYFDHDDDSAGSTLEEIYKTVKDCFGSSYLIETKRSAIRLINVDTKNDLHIDVVPGRFVDDSKTDSFLYQAEGEKCRLKTNLEIQKNHIKESGLTDIIKLIKLWKIKKGIRLKTFILELLVVKYAKKLKDEPLKTGLVSFWQYLVDYTNSLTIEDPSNPKGNDISSEFDDITKQLLVAHAKSSLNLVEQDSWESIFGKEEKSVSSKTSALRELASSFSNAPKPYVD